MSENPGPLLEGVDALLAADSQDAEILQAIDEVIPSLTTLLRGRAERIERLLVEHHRARDRAQRRRRPLRGFLTPGHLTDASPDLARALRNLGMSLFQLGRYEQSAQALGESVRLTRRLSARDPQAHALRLAETLMVLSEPLLALGRHAQALTAADESLALMQRHDSAEGSDDALRVSSLAARVRSLQETGRLDEALAAAEDAAAACRALPDDGKQDGLLPATLMNLGMLQREHGLLNDAHASTQEAIRLFRQLAGQWPDLYAPFLAQAQVNAAAILVSLGRLHEALAAAAEAVRVLRPLAVQYPEPFNEYLALALLNEAGALTDAGRYADALGPAQQALKLQRPLAAAHAGIHVGRLALALISHAKVLSMLDENDIARAEFDEAVRLCRGLSGGDDDVTAPLLAQALLTAAAALAEAGEPAVPVVEEAKSLYQRLAGRYPAAYESSLVIAQGGLAQILLEGGITDRARAEADEALRLARRLAGSGTPRDEGLLATALTLTGDVLVKVGRHSQALGRLREAAQIALRVFAADPEYDADQHVSKLADLGSSLARLDRHDEALAVGREAEQAYRTLAQARPDRYSGPLARVCAAVSDQLSELGRPAEALQAQREAVRLRRDLARDGTGEQQAALASSLVVMARLCLPAGQAVLAAECAAEAVSLLRPLAAANHEAHDSDLTEALLGLSGSLGVLRRLDEAAEAAAEAAALRRATLPASEATDDSLFVSLAAEVQALTIAALGQQAHEVADDAALLVERLRPFQAADAEGWQLLLAQALLAYAMARLAREQFPEALAAAREAEQLARAVAASSRFAPAHAAVLFTLAQALWLSDEHDDAFNAINDAVELFRPPARTGPGTYVPALSEVLGYRGQMHAHLGHADPACADSAEAADLLRPLAEHDERLGSHLVLALAQLGKHLARAERINEARGTLSEALAAYDQLDAAARDDLAGTADTIRGLLDELGQAA